MQERMKPINDFIIVSDIKEQEIVGSLQLTNEDTKHIRSQKAKVLAVSDELNGIEVDDLIYYERSRSFSLPIDGKIRTVIRKREVIVVL
jgi:co-chaperonin GroES (HSP10)